MLHERYQQKSRNAPTAGMPPATNNQPAAVTKDDHIENLRTVKAGIRQQREELDTTYGQINAVLKKYDDEPAIKPPPRNNKANRHDVYEDHTIPENRKADEIMSETTSITGSSASTSDTITMISGLVISAL